MTNLKAPVCAFNFHYTTCRNITPPGDVKYKVLTGYAPAKSFIDIPDDENVRTYLLETPGRQRARPRDVHLALRDTLENNTEEFPVLNGGIVIVSSKAEVDDKKRLIVLKSGETKVSIINGSQTKGELKRFLDNQSVSDQPQDEPIVHFQIIVTEEQELANEISIARNFQNQVAYLSILGKRASLDTLEEALQKTYPQVSLRKSETSNTGDLPPEKILQVCFALLPDALFDGLGSKTSTYSSKAKWLKVYGELVENADAKNTGGKTDPKKRQQYKCILDIVGDAWTLYKKWQKHPIYSKKYRSQRSEVKPAVTNEGQLVDGMVFPVLAAFSVFVKEKNGKWVIDIPEDFTKNFEGKLIEVARNAYKDSAKSNPPLMGKTLPCYTAIRTIPEMYMTMRETR